MLDLLFFLLPVAAFSGWLLGCRRRDRDDRAGECALSSDYYRGLNFVLNEQPDKAIEVFVHMVEVDSDTVELHLALAQLFRRRGEVDRAIRVHQNLIARPVLTAEHRNQALFELGRDYMSAGLLDRAENLFQELLEDRICAVPAARQLLEIYQQEKEWAKAIETALRLQSRGSEPLGPQIAHFHCELAETALARGNVADAAQEVRRALERDSNCVRATLFEGRLALRAGNHRLAIKALRHVAERDPEVIAEAVDTLVSANAAVARNEELGACLRDTAVRGGGQAVLTVVDLEQRSIGGRAAADFLREQLLRRPTLRGMAKLLELRAGEGDGLGPEEVEELKALCARLVRGRPGYKCRHCGFPAQRMHWQCPSCRQWNSVRPIAGE